MTQNIYKRREEEINTIKDKVKIIMMKTSFFKYNLKHFIERETGKNINKWINIGRS